MRTIIFIGTQKSGSSREAIKTAANLGYYTVLFTNSIKQIQQRSQYPDVHLMKLCNIDNASEMKSIIENLVKRGLNIKGIVSFTDGSCYIANILANEIGINHFSVDAIKTMENKIESRNAISTTIHCPKYLVINPNKEFLDNEIKEYLPAILKSPTSAGSRDVYKILDYNEFIDKLSMLRKKFPFQNLILEEFLDGQQYIAEVLVINNVVNIIGIIEQEVSFINNRFIVTGYYLLTEKPDYYDSLYNAVSTIINSHGMSTGACHLELRYVNNVWKLIEINPRISGGGMKNLIELGTGINLVEQTLNIILKKDINIKPKFRKSVYAKYITNTTNIKLITLNFLFFFFIGAVSFLSLFCSLISLSCCLKS